MNNNATQKDSGSERESIKNLLSQLAAQFASVVRGEIALATQSLREKMSDIRNGLILIAAALLIGLTAFIYLCAAVVIKSAEFMSPAEAAGLVGGVLLAISLLLAFLGYKKIKSSDQ